MDKRIEGTFLDYQRMLVAINDMLAEGYTAEQLLVITRVEEGRRLKDDTAVQVVITSDQEDSLWDKIVSFFTVEMDDESKDSNGSGAGTDEEELFEDYGIDSDTYDRFEEALDNGEYLLLVDDAPPNHIEFSDFMVRDGIINEEEDIMDKETKKSAQPDWANTNDADKGDVETHSKEAEKKVMPNPQTAKPDPMPGETAQDHVDHQVPPTEAPDPIVDDEGNEVIPKQTDASMTSEGQNDSQQDNQIQVDENVSHPEHDETMDRVSKDPFGMETEAVEKDEGPKGIEPEYDETGDNPPAL